MINFYHLTVDAANASPKSPTRRPKTNCLIYQIFMRFTVGLRYVLFQLNREQTLLLGFFVRALSLLNTCITHCLSFKG